MATAKIELPSGAIVTIEGSTKEVQDLLDHYDIGVGADEGSAEVKLRARSTTAKKATEDPQPNLAEVVNLIKSCDEAEAIEKEILDRTSEVNRVLLPLYIVHGYLDSKFGLTSVDIQKITTDLGVQVRRQNAYRSLTGSGSGYVSADKVRERGVATKYTLNRRGVKYVKSVLEGEGSEN